MSLITAAPANLRYRLFTAFAHRLVNAMLGPFVIIHMASAVNAGFAAGLIALAALLGIAGSLIGGPLSDVTGRRSMLMVGETGAAVAYAVMAAAVLALDPLLAAGAYLVATTLATAMLPAHEALILEVTTDTNRQSVYTLNYWATNVAMALGGVVGAALFHDHFALVLGIAALLMLICGAVSVLLLTETVLAVVPAAGFGMRLMATLRGYREVLRNRAFIRLLLPSALAISLELQLTGYVAIRIAGEFQPQVLLGALPAIDGPEMVGVLRVGSSLLAVALAWPVARLVRRLRLRVQMLAGVALFVGGYSVLSWSLDLWPLLLALVALTIGETVYVPIEQKLVGRVVPELARGQYMAVYGLTFSVGYLMSAAVVASVQWASSRQLTALIAAIGLCALLLFTRPAVWRDQPQEVD